MAEAFYPFVDNGDTTAAADDGQLVVRHAARIAVFDDPSAAPRVVVVEPADIRTYLEQITSTVTRLAQEQGGKIPFTVIREVVENLIHAYFMEPTISILDGGNTIRFSDQGPGIADKPRALEFGTTSATAEMKRYIRGVGSGLPYAQQWLEDKGGSLSVEDNIHQGTVVTVSLVPAQAPQASQQAHMMPSQALYQQQYAYQQGMAPAPQPQGSPSWSQAQPAAYQPYDPAVYPQMPLQAAPAWDASYQPMTPGAPLPQGTQSPWPQQAAGYPAAQPQPSYAPPAYAQQQSAYPPQQGYRSPAQPNQTLPALSERALAALDYLRTHDSVGPRDLTALQPLSESTWSRVLSQLEDHGLVSKQGGQKRRLTPLGRQVLGL